MRGIIIYWEKIEIIELPLPRLAFSSFFIFEAYADVVNIFRRIDRIAGFVSPLAKEPAFVSLRGGAHTTDAAKTVPKSIYSLTIPSVVKSQLPLGCFRS